MTRLCVLFFLSFLAAFPAVVPAQEATPAEPAATPAPAATPVAEDPAIAFLRKVEEANRDVETLYGKFSQVRENVMFSEEIHSNGEFWHTRPNKFRCDYKDPSPAQFFLIENTGYFYSPENKQLDKFKVDASEDAPINELLVGFGLKVELILDVFNVSLAEDQGTDPGQIVIDFLSRDVDRTLNFQKITIAFDKEELQPRKLVMEETEDVVRIEIIEIRKNPPIPESTYETTFPADVTVNEM
ncbi:MAG: Outer rane lipoprotein carrier protein LolA [Candidatus Sumerlaeota bacterium]|nr:Outer rane lipoprotein carrier protein LolA [Candidatus Sumerlaeota bacterium]